MMQESTADENAGKQIPSTQRIYDAVRDLREADQIATRETVAEMTGIKLAVVDDRLRAMVDDGKLKRLLRGVYELVEFFPAPRVMSCTILSNGWVKMEIADELLTLTPSEARRAARALGGFAEDARIIESTKSHLFLATKLAAQVESHQREIVTMRKMLKERSNDKQMSLEA